MKPNTHLLRLQIEVKTLQYLQAVNQLQKIGLTGKINLSPLDLSKHEQILQSPKVKLLLTNKKQ